MDLALNRCLAFSILNDNKSFIEPDCTLVLAPLTKSAIIKFGNVKLGDASTRYLAIKNPQGNSIKIQCFSTELDIQHKDISIPQKSCVYLKLVWQPERDGDFKSKIRILSGSKLLFKIFANGECFTAAKNLTFKASSDTFNKRKPFGTLTGNKKTNLVRAESCYKMVLSDKNMIEKENNYEVMLNKNKAISTKELNQKLAKEEQLISIDMPSKVKMRKSFSNSDISAKFNELPIFNSTPMTTNADELDKIPENLATDKLIDEPKDDKIQLEYKVDKIVQVLKERKAKKIVEEKKRAAITIQKWYRERIKDFFNKAKQASNCDLVNKYLQLISQKNPQTSVLKIFKALMELDKETEASKESCVSFCNDTTNGCDILFEIILRPKSYKSIIKNCLSILINIAKVPECVSYIINPKDANERLNGLIELLKTYALTNPQIFINTCILLILVVKNLGNDNFLYEMLIQSGIIVDTLVDIQILLEDKRLNQSLNFEFFFEPKWSNAEKKLIRFSNCLSAIKYLFCKALNFQP